MKEEVEGLRKKLERMEKMKEDLLNLENEKAVRVTNKPIIPTMLETTYLSTHTPFHSLFPEDGGEAPSVGKPGPVHRTQHQVRR